MSAATPALAVHDVALHLGERAVLDGVSLELAPGEVLGLAGPNGAGKTTLFRVVTGLLRPERGSVEVGGEALEALPRRALAQRVAVVPQDVTVPFPFTAGEVVLMGRAPHRSGPGFDGPADVERARARLTELGIEALADRSMPELSGGERQLVLVARALAQEPQVLLLDEPTAHLDLRHRAVVLERVAAFAAAGGAALVVSHDLAVSARHCDRIALMSAGRIAACAAPAEVLTREILRGVFDVEVEILAAADGVPLVIPRGAAPR